MKTKGLILALALSLLLAAAGAALAKGGAEPPRSVVSGGASDSTGVGSTLRATLGQPVVGIVTNAGGDIVLGQGFWHGGSYQTYLPLIRR